MKQFSELVNLPLAQSPFDPDNIPIDSGSDISLVWNQDMFTCIQPCSLKQCTPVGSTPLSVQGIGAIRFNLGLYVDSHGQRHPLEIPSVYYVPESTMNLLSTTHLKLYKHSFEPSMWSEWPYHFWLAQPSVRCVGQLVSRLWSGWLPGHIPEFRGR